MMRFAMLSTSYTGSINYHYNSRDLLAQVINGRGQQREFAYDAANRLVSITDVDGTISFTYDNNGNILTVKDNQGTITRTYDALNRVTSYTDVNGNTIHYAYDSIGNLTTLTYPDGKQVHYDYNALSQLIQVIDWAGRTIRYEYDANGRLIKTTRPNGTQQLRSYDVKGQLLQQRDILNQTVITQFDYRYDAVGNIIEETKQPVNVVPNIQLEMSYAPANQLATVNQQAVELDADGNMINGILNGQLTQFNFDSRNRLIQVGDTIYRYDAENHRIAVNQTQFVVNPQPALSQVLVRTKGNGEVTYYVYGLGLIGEESAGNYFSYHFDYRGSTVALTNAVGQVVDKIAYSAYGELLTQPTHDTPFLFNGMYGVMSDDNGLYYMRARFYSPEIKRFVNQDVLIGNIADGQSLNRYAFVTGKPVSFIDPFGFSERDPSAPLNLGDKYTGRVDIFNYGGQASFEIHVYDPKGIEVGVYGEQGWINKHGHISTPTLPDSIHNSLKGLTIEMLRKMGRFPIKGIVNIKGDKWRNLVKACKVLGPLSIPISFGVSIYLDEEYGIGDMICDAVWGCPEPQ